jgi:hypothetical protein
VSAVEIGLAHAHLLQEAERGRQLANLNIALTQAKAEAEAGSKAKSQFLAVVSHEIRYAPALIAPLTHMEAVRTWLISTMMTATGRR